MTDQAIHRIAAGAQTGGVASPAPSCGDDAVERSPVLQTAAETGHRWRNSIGKASPEELDLIRTHFLRLDRDALYSRFGNVVTEDFLLDYVARAPALETTFFCCRINGHVRGVAELRRFEPGRSEEAEAAFSVESPFADLGIGTALMEALRIEARLVGVRRLYMCFSPHNRRMRRITQKFLGSVSFDGSDCIGRVSIAD
jgi:GNAT superfamily N-acetyltransferase